MPLVPNGRMRLMVAQTMSNKDPNNAVSGQAGVTQPAPRNDVQQEQVGATTATPEPKPEVAGEVSAEPQELGIDTPSPDMAQSPNGDGQTEEMSTADSTLKRVWEKVMRSLGIEPRQIEAGGTELFSLELDIDSSTMSGFYKIPTHAKSGEIDLEKAKGIANQIGGKFGLHQKLKMHRDNNGHTNWRVDYKSMPQKQQDDFGNSFNGIGKAHSEGNDLKKAASLNLPTMGEMLKSRKDMLYNTMRKIANRSE